MRRQIVVHRTTPSPRRPDRVADRRWHAARPARAGPRLRPDGLSPDPPRTKRLRRIRRFADPGSVLSGSEPPSRRRSPSVCGPDSGSLDRRSTPLEGPRRPLEPAPQPGSASEPRGTPGRACGGPLVVEGVGVDEPARRGPPSSSWPSQSELVDEALAPPAAVDQHVLQLDEPGEVDAELRVAPAGRCARTSRRVKRTSSRAPPRRFSHPRDQVVEVPRAAGSAAAARRATGRAPVRRAGSPARCRRRRLDVATTSPPTVTRFDRPLVLVQQRDRPRSASGTSRGPAGSASARRGTSAAAKGLTTGSGPSSRWAFWCDLPHLSRSASSEQPVEGLRLRAAGRGSPGSARGPHRRSGPGSGSAAPRRRRWRWWSGRSPPGRSTR